MASTVVPFGEKQSFKTVLVNNLSAREVECHVRLTIHSVTDLPLVSGAFKVRWKFRDVDSRPTRHIHQHKPAAHPDALDFEHDATPTISDPYSGRPPPSNDPLLTQAPRRDLKSQKPVAYAVDERGQTPYMKLRARDHTVSFEHTVDVVAHMRVVKGELIGDPLKLVVEQVRSEITD